MGRCAQASDITPTMTDTYTTIDGSVMRLPQMALKHRLLLELFGAQVTRPHLDVQLTHVLGHLHFLVRLIAAAVHTVT